MSEREKSYGGEAVLVLLRLKAITQTYLKIPLRLQRAVVTTVSCVFSLGLFLLNFFQRNFSHKDIFLKEFLTWTFIKRTFYFNLYIGAFVLGLFLL